MFKIYRGRINNSKHDVSGCMQSKGGDRHVTLSLYVFYSTNIGGFSGSDQMYFDTNSKVIYTHLNIIMQ